jgi:hypothetical protein
MAGGNGTYEPIPDSENGVAHESGGSGKKWLLASAVAVAVAGAVYGATTFLGGKKSSSVESLLNHSKLNVNADGKLKLFDDLSM